MTAFHRLSPCLAASALFALHALPLQAENVTNAPPAEATLDQPRKIAFDAGADLRIREEIMENVPGLPNGGVLCRKRTSGYINHLRYRPRVWGEMRLGEHFRIYARITDEFRQYIHPWKNANTWPDEVILDNLFIEGKGLFGDFLDFTIGRQDATWLCGLDHVFVDMTPSDGSRSVFTDMARTTLHVTDTSKVDLFGLYDTDDNPLRWGTDRGNHRVLCGLDPAAEAEMDDWGFGAIWSSEINRRLPYQVFVLQKNTLGYRDSYGGEHPWAQRETIGTKWVPKLDEAWSLQLEGMGQVGCNGDGATLSGWSSYAGVNWKSATASTIRPFGKFGYHFMSGDDDAADEDGGYSAWDPIWARAVNDSEMFLYGTHYGAGWWSNMHYVKFTLGLDLGAHHRLCGSCGPLFAAAQDGMGGGNGMFKGFLSQARYDFPIWLADRERGERFEIFAHLVAELFNPGDYYETDKPAYFLRWQVDFKF